MLLDDEEDGATLRPVALPVLLLFAPVAVYNVNKDRIG